MSTNPQEVSFFAPTYLKEEIEENKAKLVEKSHLTAEEVDEQLGLVYDKIYFILDSEIPMSHYLECVRWVREVDIDDLVFVAMNDYLNSTLWTGDTRLYRHLVRMGYNRVINFEEIKETYS